MARDCRAAAATALARVIAGGEALDRPLADALEQVDNRDRALLQQLCYGGLRHYHRFEGLLRQCLKSPLKKRDADIHALLLIGLLQLMEMRTPDHAAISTCVDAARALGKPWATKLVNGVLRRCLREKDKLLSALSEHEAARHPTWLVDALRAAWPEHYEEVLDANNGNPPMCLRVNRQVTDRAAYIKKLEDAGLGGSPCILAADGIRLEHGVEVGALAGFAEGEVSVQDEAAQLAAGLLAPGPGERVLDACSAPGSKTCHLLEWEPKIAELVAMDSDADRLARVADNLERLSLQARLVCGDARSPDAELGEFDRILVDAPCSGTGVIRRHPDIKLLRRAEDIAGFAALQLDILRGLWPLLKPGGRLLYVTCSVLPEENAQCAATFLEETADAECLDLPGDWGIAAGPGRQLLSRPDGWDGLFYALLEKRG